VLVPEGRYARMRNVYAIPTVATLTDWLAEAGLRQVRVVGISVTSSDEQRATSWMRFQSLADFLDPSDPRRTVEGYPAPTRAMLLVER
jgi:tRNA (mo5U34)-methyltransferase